MKFTLRQIEVFLATADCQNISRAASELAMSQSAASGALKDLEDRYEAKLFDRVGKRLRLNHLGESLRPLAESLLDTANRVDALISDQESVTKLNVGATLTIGNYISVPIVAICKERHPDLQINLHFANTSSIAAQVLNYEIDVGLIEGEYSHPDLTVETWAQDELVIFASPDHPLVNYESLTDEQIINADWILREKGSGTRQTFDRTMQGLLNDIKVNFEFEHTEAIKRAVQSGLGLGCLSPITLKDEFKNSTLIPLKVPQRDMKRNFYFVTHNKKFKTKSLQSWLECCREFYTS
tara:strand:- start:159 stop:1046 length:888 start_codon:yes stop_codon:yes gene_type:complete